MSNVYFALVSFIWVFLFLLDNFLKTQKWSSRAYLQFLNSSGLSISPAQIRWYSSYWNRLFLKIGTWKPRFLKVWFTCGVCFGVVAMVLSIGLLTVMIVNTFQQKPPEEQVLTPVVPGVNLPMSQIFYYLTTLFLCGILHEIGHAVAAVREQVRVNGFGIFVFLIYPGAFVDLYTDHLQVISPLRQLRIYCAGVWHNFILVLLAICVLISMPWAFSPMYSLGGGVVVDTVSENSAVYGSRGLISGDEIYKINNCRVNTMQGWSICIKSAIADENSGFCMPMEQVRQQDISIKAYKGTDDTVECCANTSNTHMCFTYHTKSSSSQNHSCLPARSTSEKPSCKLPSDCKMLSSTSVCVIPSLDSQTKLIKVYRSKKPAILFLGHPLDLHYSISMSDYVPKTSIFPIGLPYVVETLSKYVISLSGALAVLNVVPCYALDGQWILLALMEYSLRSLIPNREVRGFIYSIVLLFGTFLLAANIFIAMWVLFFR